MAFLRFFYSCIVTSVECRTFTARTIPPGIQDVSLLPRTNIPHLGAHGLFLHIMSPVLWIPKYFNRCILFKFLNFCQIVIFAVSMLALFSPTWCIRNHNHTRIYIAPLLGGFRGAAFIMLLKLKYVELRSLALALILKWLIGEHT